MENILKTNPQIGPVKVTAVSFVLKILSGLGGGLIGSLLILAIFLVNSAVLNPVLKASGETINPLFIIIFLGMIFLSSLSANLTATVLITLSDSNRYYRISSMIYQIFIANLIVFLIITPIYIIGWGINITVLPLIAGIHVIISAVASSLILKIISQPNYGLLGVYTMIFAILTALGVTVLFYNVSGSNLTVVLFTALPVMWLCLGFYEALIGSLYYAVYSFYGTDFLHSQTAYGSDFGAEEEADDPSAEDKEKALLSLRKDEKGEDFLKKSNK